MQERLTFFGWVGCFLCIVGSVIIGALLSLSFWTCGRF